jgi:poly(A) polymerase Pap1
MHNELRIEWQPFNIPEFKQKTLEWEWYFLYSKFTLRYKIWVAIFSYSKIQEKTLKCEWEHFKLKILIKV